MKMKNLNQLVFHKRLKAFDKVLMEKYVGPEKLAGTQTLVARKGSIVHFHSQGREI